MRNILLLFIMLTFSHVNFSAAAPIYRTLILPYEETFLENSHELIDKYAELISSFYGLSPAYAALVLAHSRGVLAEKQLEELFPGQKLNSFILAEYNRYLAEKLPTMRTDTAAGEFLTELKKRGGRVFVYSTTNPKLAAEDIERRKLPLQFIAPPAEPLEDYPQLERVLSRYSLPAATVLVLGGSQQECNRAGLSGLDFALYHEMVEGRVDGASPCRILYKVEKLRDLKALTVKPAASGAKTNGKL